MSNLRFLVPLLILAVLAIAVMIWQNPDDDADLNIPTTTGIGTFDPRAGSWSDEIRAYYALFEGMVSVDPDTMQVVPGVAERWEISEDKQTYHFYLRQDAKWSDGSPVTAEDFRVSWAMGMMSPDFAMKYAKFHSYIKGVDAYKAWTRQSHEQIKQADVSDDQRLKMARDRIDEAFRKFDELVSVKVLNDHELIISSNGFVPYFLDIIAFPAMFPVHGNSLINNYKNADGSWAINKNTNLLEMNSDWLKAGNLISNGPYFLKRWRFKRDILFQKNTHYWNAASVKSDTVKLTYYGDMNLAYLEYRAGRVDLIISGSQLTYSSDLVKEQREGKRNDMHQSDLFGTYMLMVNTRPKLNDGRVNPLADARVRQALMMSIDRSVVTDDVNKMFETGAKTLIPPGSIPGYESPSGYEFNPEKARALLAEAGYPNGEGMPEIEIKYNSGGGHQDRIQAIANMIQKNLNINARGIQVDKTQISGQFQEGDFMLGRMGWIGDYQDPTTFLNLFREGAPYNYGDWNNPEFNTLMKKASETSDREQRMRLYHEAEKLLINQETAVLTIYHYLNLRVYDPDKVSGVSDHIRGLLFYSRIEVKD